MKWKLISEAYTPEDMSIIDVSFHKDVSNERYTPTIGFLKNAYHKLNVELFNGELPEDIEFKIENRIENNSAGMTDASDPTDSGNIIVNYVALNGTVMRTIHGWLETILHEMIHIYDFKFNSEHFQDKDYDEHIDWFEGFAKRFRKDGFKVKTELDKDDVSISVDDENIKNKHQSEIYLKISHNPLGWDDVLKIKSSDRDSILNILKKSGYKSVVELSTNNLNAVRLTDTDVESPSKISTYHMDDDFRKEYGPFEEIETIDLTKMTFDESTFSRKRHSSSTFVRERLPNGGWHYMT